MKRTGILFFMVLTLSCTTERNIDFVNPFIGTGGHGHTYPGPSMPFGMIQLGPDTRLSGWDGCSGYHFTDSVVYGFSHTHLSGTGISDYGDILFMPTTGDIYFSRGDEFNTQSGYCSQFRKSKEQASPGFYSLLLDDYNILVELTVTERSGYHRYTFPESENSHIIIDLEHRDPVIESRLEITSNTEITGYRRSSQWARDQRIYFYAVMSKPFESYLVMENDTLAGDSETGAGTDVKAALNFSTSENEQITVKIGISAVNAAGAKNNLTTEIGDRTFDEIRTEAEDTWKSQLGKILIRGGTREKKEIFYTAFYHASLNPNLYMDADRLYRGRDMKIHEAESFDYYTLFSLWDTFRGAHPLFTIIEPDRTVDFIKTFLVQYDQGGLLPVWELSANETMTMIGYHSVPVIVDAYIKGIRDFDIEKAFEAMKNSAELNHYGLKAYRKFGFIPVSEESESVSKTLEYAYDDWCIAQMAKKLGKEEDYECYIKRAQSFKNIFDPTTGFMRGRINGGWFTPFDPREVNFNYTEANSWQYSFFVPQDITGLMKIMGGSREFVEKLDQLFSENSETTGRDQADITGLIGQYAHGNEPSHHMAYLYNFAGKPARTQEIVSQITRELYTADPDGLCGNEDAGQMSAWYLLSAMGFYPVTPGTDYYIIGTPAFKKTRIKLPDGKLFRIVTENLSEKNIYVQSAKLNGKEYTRSFIRHEDIVSGGELILKMGLDPDSNWGTGEEDIPVTEISDHLIQPAPFVVRGDRTFFDSTVVVLGATDGAEIYYTLDGSEPSGNSDIFRIPIVIEETTILKAFAQIQGRPTSVTITAEFRRMPPGRSIRLLSDYAPQYSAGGEMALIDFIRGPGNFRTGAWQGYEGQDLVAVVDLGKPSPINTISVGFLQDAGSWIFMPEYVEFLISDDGETFIPVGRVRNDISQKDNRILIKEFGINVYPKKVRYVKVVAGSIINCPDWHKGAGGKAWLFA
ncbi:MAG: GH92 family glycosyl hydrolase, partial [Bacteroidales bacterium]